LHNTFTKLIDVVVPSMSSSINDISLGTATVGQVRFFLRIL